MTLQPADIVGHFCFEGDFVDAAPYGNGHINHTYAVRFTNAKGQVRRYLLQKINKNVFRDPVALMANIARVTQHLQQKISAAGGDPMRQSLALVPTVDGAFLHRDGDNNYWRACHFIEGAQAHETATSLTHVYRAAKAFGNFQRMLADFPANALHEVIPDFHNTPKRLADFREAVMADRAGRVVSVAAEIAFVEERAAQTTVLVELLKQGALPLRVTHNDTKFSNVLMDDVTGEALCVIDLETVMPGTALYDFGDAVRAGAALAAEDEPDFTQAGISLQTFDALTRGYLDAARDFLTPTEVEQLAFSARLITLEQAIRFLADYLNGDSYYKIHRPLHNLERSRTQIKMVLDMEEKFDEMRAIVARHR